MEDFVAVPVQQKAKLFQKALENANGPVDADHITYVIMLATADDHIETTQEIAEQDFLLTLLIHEIRHKKPQLRSYENIYENLSANDLSLVESILKISEYWKSASDGRARLQILAGVQARLLQVLLADDPEYIAA